MQNIQKFIVDLFDDISANVVLDLAVNPANGKFLASIMDTTAPLDPHIMYDRNGEYALNAEGDSMQEALDKLDELCK